MTKKPKPNQRKQQAYEQAVIETLLNQSAIFRRQYADLQAYFPGWRINAVRTVGC